MRCMSESHSSLSAPPRAGGRASATTSAYDRLLGGTVRLENPLRCSSPSSSDSESSATGSQGSSEVSSGWVTEVFAELAAVWDVVTEALVEAKDDPTLGG